MFQTTSKNAPNWYPHIELDHNVSFQRNHCSLTVFPNLFVEDKKGEITLDCYGLRYKHFDKFQVNIVDGQTEKIQTALFPVGHPTGSEKYQHISIKPTSEKGVIQITDSFETHSLSWHMTNEYIFLQYGDFKTMIHFEDGVIDIPNEKANDDYIDFLKLAKTKTDDPELLQMYDRHIARVNERNNLN
jgi:hypothetical protein